VDEKLKVIVGQWLIKGDNDLKTAEYALGSADPITDTICFHCQQAVEKYLKMYLVSKGDDPVITHNISILIANCSRYESSFKDLGRYDFLTGYAVALRYPDDFYMPEVDEAREALAAAQMVRAYVMGLMV
jgi:HEPN domain-containing protein